MCDFRKKSIVFVPFFVHLEQNTSTPATNHDFRPLFCIVRPLFCIVKLHKGPFETKQNDSSPFLYS
jgi:hypothetical protein